MGVKYKNQTFYININPSILGAFAGNQKKGWEYFQQKLLGIPFKDNEYTKKGKELHEKYGFNNPYSFEDKMFLKVKNYDFLITIRGRPDKIFPLQEFKTVWRKKISDKQILSGNIQLQCYMWMLGFDESDLIFMHAPTEEKILELKIKKNEGKLKNVVYEFCKKVLEHYILLLYTGDTHA